MFIFFMILINCAFSYQILYKLPNIIFNSKLYCSSNNDERHQINDSERQIINNSENQSFQFNKNKVDEIKERLNNLCCGEVNEKYDIDEYEQLEKEMLEIFQKMRKHNLKTAYTKINSLYKLFNKK